MVTTPVPVTVKTPLHVPVPVPVPLLVSKPISTPGTPVSIPTLVQLKVIDTCGLLRQNFFCPRPGNSGVLRRRFKRRGC
jgi:hypothetical protein